MYARLSFRSLTGVAMGIALSMPCALAQRPGNQAPPASPSPSPSPSPGAGSVPRTPSPSPSPSPTPSPFPGPGRTQPQQPYPGQQQEQPFPEYQRPYFFSGKVILDDGTPPPDSVVIETVCNGMARPQAYTDTKGRFSFQLGQNTAQMADASVGSIGGPMGGPMGGYGQRQPGMGGTSPMGTRGMGERDLMACELRASLPGFQSDVVQLGGRRSLDNPDVGTIILHRMGNVEGTTISATSLQAPKDARKAYDKGRDAIKKKKWDEAQKHLDKAVELYPRYAAAWFELGMLRQRDKDAAGARKAYSQALSADPKYLKPYLQMAILSAQDQNWKDVVDTTDRLIRLDPLDFPEAYYFNCIANYNLKNYDAAEKSALEVVKMDKQHRMPQADHLLGVLLANKQDYAGAVVHMKNYLQFAPNAADQDLVRKQLTELERLSGTSAAAQQQTPGAPKQ